MKGGLRVTRSKNGLILEVPLRDGNIVRYVTSISGIIALINNIRTFIFFNPIRRPHATAGSEEADSSS